MTHVLGLDAWLLIIRDIASVLSLSGHVCPDVLDKSVRQRHQGILYESVPCTLPCERWCMGAHLHECCRMSKMLSCIEQWCCDLLYSPVAGFLRAFIRQC